MKRRQFLGCLVATALLAACHSADKQPALAKGATVVALGDSLTFGYGASRGQDYPSLLAKKSGWQVINSGVNGDTSADVLARLDGVIDQDPALVLLGVGGNDVLRRVPPSTTKNNLLKIVTTLQDNNIDVVIIAEPYFSVGALLGKAKDNPIYKEVAEETGADLFAKEWSAILSDERLKSDQIHANDQGYKQFSDRLYAFLQDKGYAN